MKKVIWMLAMGLLVAGCGFSQDKSHDGKAHKRQEQKEDVPRDVQQSNRMKENLALSDEQYEKVLEINKGIELERAEVMTKMQALRKAHGDQLKEVLTEEQWKKWNENAHKRGKGGKAGKGHGKKGRDREPE